VAEAVVQLFSWRISDDVIPLGVPPTGPDAGDVLLLVRVVSAGATVLDVVVR
jgi:hypothetical protein